MTETFGDNIQKKAYCIINNRRIFNFKSNKIKNKYNIDINNI